MIVHYVQLFRGAQVVHACDVTHDSHVYAFAIHALLAYDACGVLNVSSQNHVYDALFHFNRAQDLYEFDQKYLFSFFVAFEHPKIS